MSQLIIDDGNSPFDEKEGYNLILPQKIPDNEINPSQRLESDVQITPQKMPAYKNIPSKYQERDDRIPPQLLTDDEVVPSEDQEGVGLFSHITKSFTVKYTCLRRLERPFFLIKGTKGLKFYWSHG